MKRNLFVIAATFIIIIAMLGYSRINKSDEIKDGFRALNLLEEDTYADEDLINLLLLGLDRRSPEDDSRSDSMIVLTIDKKNKRVKATSLMRDMYVEIPGNSSNKINAAYTYGGGLLAMETVNRNFGLEIRDFVAVDFFGFERIIDRLGGVEIDVKSIEAPHCFVDKPGPQVLNGKQVLAYSRLRKVGKSDFERTDRQRRVLNEIYKKIKLVQPKELTKLARELLPSVETSLNLREMINIADEASKFNIDKIDELRIPVPEGFTDENINGASCLVPDMKKNVNKLHEHIFGTNRD